MPLSEPPAPTRLAALPRWLAAGRTLHRVHRADRGPWWFATRRAGAADEPGGRFDLPEPLGACYWALSPLAAVLEAFQHFGAGLLPDAELRARRRAELVAPPGAPVAANVAAAAARGAGVTAALWAGGDRALTQRWALALHRAGWRAVHHGISHDPAGRLRALTLFDTAGAHPPYDDPAGWRAAEHLLHDDRALRAGLARYGVTVTTSGVSLPVVRLEDTGLADRP